MEMTKLDGGNMQVILTPDETEFMYNVMNYFKDNKGRLMKLALNNLGIPAVD